MLGFFFPDKRPMQCNATQYNAVEMKGSVVVGSCSLEVAAYLIESVTEALDFAMGLG